MTFRAEKTAAQDRKLEGELAMIDLSRRQLLAGAAAGAALTTLGPTARAAEPPGPSADGTGVHADQPKLR